MSSSFLNGADWAKQFISKNLHITHSQWIFRNFSLHDKRNSYLHKKKVEEIALELESLAGLAPEDVPAESRFLLEINFHDLNKSNIESKKYWFLAINAALTAQRRQLARGARAKRITDKVNRKLPSRTKRGIVAVEQQIRLDQCHFLPRQEEHTCFQESNQSSINGLFTKKPPHPAAIVSLLKSNKRLQKPDWGNTLPVRGKCAWGCTISLLLAFHLNPESGWTVTKRKDHFMVFPVALPQPCCAHTRQSKRPISVQIVHRRLAIIY